MNTSFIIRRPPEAPSSLFQQVGRLAMSVTKTILGQWTLFTIAITSVVMRRKATYAITLPLVYRQVYLAGIRLLPATLFIGFCLGAIIVGQLHMLAGLSGVDPSAYLGVAQAIAVVRELGPLAVALLVLARVGAPTVVELGNARASGEIEALESLAIDPVHSLVAPRLIGTMISVSSLTILISFISILSSYACTFLTGIAPFPMDYLDQLSGALTLWDLPLMLAKSLLFGAFITISAAYRGLARPIRLDEVSQCTTRCIVESFLLCLAVDVLFVAVYYVL